MFLINPFVYSGASGYLVDDFSPSYAYSLEALSSSTTNVIRVRRSSDNAESDFSASDITDGTLTTWTGINNGFVTKWYEQVGTGRDLEQTTSGNQPQLVFSGVVDVDGIYFSGAVGKRLVLTTAYSRLSELDAPPFSLFAVYQADSKTLFNCVLANSTLSNRIEMYAGVNTTTKIAFLMKNTIAQVYRLDPTTAVPLSTQTLQTAIIGSGGAMEGFIDGTSFDTNTFIGTMANNDLTVGGTGATVNHWLTGNIKEIIIFGTDEDTNRTDIEANINDRYIIF